MLKFEVAHVVGSDRDEEGRCHAMTMLNRHENGVLVWAGKLHRNADSKQGASISPGDYFERQTVSFMSWADVATYFEGGVYRLLVDQLMVSAKRHEHPEGVGSRDRL